MNEFCKRILIQHSQKGCYLCTASRFRLPDYDRLKRNHFVYTAVFGNFSAHFNRRTNSAYNIQNPTESETGGFSVIELIQHGMYLVNGVPCESVPVPPAEARRETMAYKILQAHNTSGDPEKLKITFDALVSHDITYVGIIQQARASGMKQFPMPYALTNCHNSLCAVGGTINEDDHVFGLSAAKNTAESTFPQTSP